MSEIKEKPWYAHYDPGVPHQVEYPQAPLWKLLENSATNFPDREAVNFLGMRGITYRELWESVRRFAAGLQDRGVKKGDRVAIALPNTIHYVIAYYGTMLVGAVVVNLSPLYTARELRDMLGDSGAETLVVLDFMGWPRYLEIEHEVPIRQVITARIQDYLPFPISLIYPLKAMHDKTYIRLPRHPKRIGFTEFLRRANPNPEPVSQSPDDLALLQFTSGTTGMPKAAMLSHRNLMTNAYQTISWTAGKLEPGKEVFLCLIPFFHVFGMTVGMNSGISIGATLMVMPQPDLKEAIALIEKFGVTVMPGVPTLYVGFNNFPGIENRKVGQIKICVSGAAPLPVEVARRFEELTGGKLIEGYGLTESSPVTNANPLYGLRRVGSIGLPFPSVDVKVVEVRDGQIAELPVGEEGELAVKGPNVMMGYWHRPLESAETLIDGWLLTGDVAKQDEDGYFYIVDRKKDLIIASGYNVYPREVEEVLFEHPAVMEAAVVGVPDPYRGENVKAVIVLRPEFKGKTSEEDIIAFSRKSLAAYKIPRKVEFRDELPKNIVGKVLRRELKEDIKA